MALSERNSRYFIEKNEILNQVFDRINNGQDTTDLRKKIAVLDLKQQSDSPFELSVEFICGCCPECDKRSGQQMPYEQAVTEQPIPFKECTRPFTGCVCCYGFNGVRDNNDRLIFKG